ncbi:MAG: MBOAT family protein [Oscillospiraceae bacterium]|nr:MBOAT family protein [Oscillospiraceae bacterium]
MVFSSTPFLFFYLPAVLAVYYLLPRRGRNLWLFLVNLVFYGWGEPVYLLLMLFSIALNYAAGLLIHRFREERAKAKRVLAVSVVLNLALLGFFKYYDMFARTLSLIPGLTVPVLGLSLPIGISFYTFQTMSYPIDVYRGDSGVQRSFISFGTFVALFPQLIAGPIVRYKDVAEQLSFRATSPESFASGVRRFIIGLGKKVLIANNIGMLWTLYSAKSPGELTAFGTWMAVTAFHFQIYFDFSGYSDMAIGLGRLLGFSFPENFNYPYISKSVTEHWRRWHMSLGSWFRDYVYIPLGGNRCGKGRQILNIAIVWALTGLWHGANWTFLVWGLYFAFFLIIEKLFLLRGLEKVPPLARLYTFLVVLFSWVIFELPGIPDAVRYYASMFGGGAGLVSAADLYYLKEYALMFAVAIVSSLPLGKNLYARLSPRLRAAVTPVLIALVLVLSTAYLVDATYNPFLYFRF